MGTDFGCYQCPNKQVGCHINCEKHIKRKQKIAEDKEKKRLFDISNGVFHMYGCPAQAENSNKYDMRKKPRYIYARGKS